MGQNKERLHVDVMALHPEVTGSLLYVNVREPNGERVKFAVDGGLFREPEYELLNYELPFEAEDLEFILVTHNHVDHTGRLPLLAKKGFWKKIYVTEPTAFLIGNALYDTCQILQETAKRRKEKPLFRDSDVDNVLKRIEPCKYRQCVTAYEDEEITIKVTFFENGHLVGASLILVQIESEGYDSLNFLFTGDYNKDNIFFDVPDLPDWLLELPITIVTESTYGDSKSDQKVECFEKNVLDMINNGGTVIVPVFAIGRAQEILYRLRCMQERGELSTSIPIYLDGKLAIKYTELYLKKPLGLRENMVDFLPDNFHYVGVDTRDYLIQSADAKIVLTTSGMGTFGPAKVYIPEYIQRENALIHFTGYVVKGWSRDLIEAEYDSAVSIRNSIYKKRARVETTNEFSGHARADVLIEFLQQFKNLKLVMINHGETQTKKIFAEEIFEKVSTKNVCILGREYFFRVGAYGLIKSITTKFMRV